MSDRLDADLTQIAEYITGEGSPHDAAALEALMHDRPDYLTKVLRVQGVLESIRMKDSAVLDTNVFRTAVAKRTGIDPHTLDPACEPPMQSPRPAPLIRPTKVTSWTRVHRWRVAALASIVFAGVGLMLYHKPQTLKTSQNFSTQPGQQQTVRLPSGTTMQLAPATSVRVVSTSSGAAYVEIAGEAYFTVAPNRVAPLIVQTKNSVVQVLGTRFSVRQYPDEMTSRVVVAEGRVGLRKRSGAHAHHDGVPTNAVILSANMMAQINDSTVRVVSGSPADVLMSWTQGTLVFNRTALSDVLMELSRAYGVTLRVEDSVLARQVLLMKVTVREQPLSHVLAMIGSATDAIYRNDGRTIVFVPKDDTQTAPRRDRIPQPEKSYGR